MNFKNWPPLRIAELLGAGLCGAAAVLGGITIPGVGVLAAAPLTAATAFLAGRAFPRVSLTKEDVAAAIAAVQAAKLAASVTPKA